MSGVKFDKLIGCYETEEVMKRKERKSMVSGEDAWGDTNSCIYTLSIGTVLYVNFKAMNDKAAILFIFTKFHN